MIHLDIKTIEGDGQTTGFEKQIDCTSFSFGASNTADANTSDGLTRSASNVQQISLASRVGKQSLNLMKAAVISQHIDTAVLHFTKTAADNKVVEWMKITMTNAVVSSYSVSSTEDDMGYESTTLAFESFKAEYFLIDVKGAKTNGPTLDYNIMKREKS